MTEADWFNCTDAVAMLKYLEDKVVATARKLCLFTCASLRRQLSDQQPLLGLLAVADRRVEGSATTEELRIAVADLEATYGLHSLRMNLVRHCLTIPIDDRAATEWRHHATAAAAMEWRHYATAAAACAKAEAGAAAHDAGLLRDIFLSPLVRRWPRVSPSWRRTEGPVYLLAEAIYQERAFDRLPILSDALEEAGCTDRAILNHCRSGGEHVRGCWVVDLLTGRK